MRVLLCITSLVLLFASPSAAQPAPSPSACPAGRLSAAQGAAQDAKARGLAWPLRGLRPDRSPKTRPVETKRQNASPTRPTAARGPERAISADSAAIRQVALDYVKAWYARDAERMRQAVHPDLAKRIVWRTGDADRLGHQSADELVRTTGEEASQGPRVPEGEGQTDVTILDIYCNIAVVRVDSDEYVDYLQVARWKGAWTILNILWDLKPGVVQGQHKTEAG